MNHDEASVWRGAVVVAVSVLTATAAHARAGGGTPGPGGLVVLALLLAPVALIVRHWAGIAGLLVAGAAGQLVGHVGLGVVAGSGHSAHAGHAVADQAAPAGHHHTDPDTLGAAVDAAGGWSSLTEPLAHLAHMGPAMASAHAGAVIATAALVTAVTAGLRRIAHRFVVLLRAVLLPDTGPEAARPAEADRAPAAAPLLLTRPPRGPPRGSDVFSRLPAPALL